MQNIRSKRSLRTWAPIALLAGVVVALVAQFGLDALADRGDFFHQLQHGLLFAGGISVGAAVLALHRSGQRPA